MTVQSAKPRAPDDGVETHRDVIARLRRQIAAVLEPITRTHRGASFALLDFPDHGNVGDSAIFAGESAWTRANLGRGPAYICRHDVERRELLEALPAGMVFLHGGGNFGDVWPQFQAFRENVMGLLPGRPVVQMPQSLHFADPAGVDRAAAAIADHGAFTLLVRDTASLDLARERFGCPVHLCPDMAFAIGEIARPRPPDLDVLLLLRTDKEAAVDRGATLGKLPAGWQVADWLEDAANHNRRALWGARLAVLRTGDPAAALPRNRSLTYFRLLAEGRVERGIEMLSRARFVVTDRLHGHILCTLCGIPHAFLDNTYGKITRFASTFGTVWSGVTRAGSLEEGIAAAQAHLARGPERNGTWGP